MFYAQYFSEKKPIGKSELYETVEDAEHNISDSDLYEEADYYVIIDAETEEAEEDGEINHPYLADGDDYGTAPNKDDDID